TYLQAVSTERYRIQLVRPHQPNVNVENQNPDQVMKSVAWLKAQNAQGADIYIRPQDRRFALIDDVSLDAIEKMKSDGLEPCCWTETSKDNYQTWIRVVGPDQPEPTPEEATTIAKALAKTYGGDMA